MNFFKPRFWDKNQSFFFPVLLFPIALILKVLFYLKKNFTKTHKFSIPVICVGNIYLGGTGKTPLSIEIYSILKNLNMNPVFIRKKYKSFQDEATLQAHIGPIYQNKKRINAIKEAIKSKANIVILDDGFQDFSIKKNLSIVCFDSKQSEGNGLTIPSGPLRENLSALKRADCVVINGDKNSNIEKKIISKNNEIKIFYTKNEVKNIDNFKNKKITAFAGIGNPENFFSLLKTNNIDVIKEIKFPDHHFYSKQELENLFNISKENSSILITTEKDYFRIEDNYKKKIDFLKISTVFQNQNEFIKLIKKII